MNPWKMHLLLFFIIALMKNILDFTLRQCYLAFSSLNTQKVFSCDISLHNAIY